MSITVTPETRNMLKAAGYSIGDFQNGLSKEQYQRFSGQGVAALHPQGQKVGQLALDAMRAYAMSGGNAEQAMLMARSSNGDTGAAAALKGGHGMAAQFGADDGSSSNGLNDGLRGFRMEAQTRARIDAEAKAAESRGNVLKHVNGQTVEVTASQDVNERFDHSGAGAGAATPFGANGVQNPHGVDY